MDLRDSMAKQTAFALRLAGAAAGKLATGHTPGGGGNAVLSPLSLHVVLSMVAAGARGPTLDELVAVLGPGGSAGDLAALAAHVVELLLSDGSSAGGPRVACADGVWVDASVSLKPAFEEVATAKFKAVAQSVDFRAKAAEVTNQINSWVEKVTSGLIKDLLPLGSVGSNTRLVLGNALYFKGAWTEKFDASKTRESEFHLLDGSTVQVPFMAGGKTQYVAAHDDFKVLKLPYEQGDDKRQFSMYIFLPEARDGLWSLAGKLSSGPEFLNNHLPVRKVAVGEFKIPKFKISFGLEASDLLQGLGLKLPFGANADLTGMVDSPVGRDLYVSSIFHKSFIEVNEEGTEAAAASAAVVGLRSSRPRQQDFVADHPFLFLIREDVTGVVMFIGHMLNPRLAE